MLLADVTLMPPAAVCDDTERRRRCRLRRFEPRHTILLMLIIKYSPPMVFDAVYAMPPLLMLMPLRPYTFITPVSFHYLLNIILYLRHVVATLVILSFILLFFDTPSLPYISAFSQSHGARRRAIPFLCHATSRLAILRQVSYAFTFKRCASSMLAVFAFTCHLLFSPIISQRCIDYAFTIYATYLTLRRAIERI